MYASLSLSLYIYIYMNTPTYVICTGLRQGRALLAKYQGVIHRVLLGSQGYGVHLYAIYFVITRYTDVLMICVCLFL